MEKKNLHKVEIIKGNDEKIEGYFHHWFSQRRENGFQLLGIVELIDGTIQCLPQSQIDFVK